MAVEAERLFLPVPEQVSDFVMEGARDMLLAGYGRLKGPMEHLRQSGGIDEFTVKSRKSDEWYDTHVDVTRKIAFCSCPARVYCAHIHVCRCVLSTPLWEEALGFQPRKEGKKTRAS